MTTHNLPRVGTDGASPYNTGPTVPSTKSMNESPYRNDPDVTVSPGISNSVIQQYSTAKASQKRRRHLVIAADAVNLTAKEQKGHSQMNAQSFAVSQRP